MDPREQKYGSESRRDFLKMTAVIPLALSLGGFRNGEVAADTSQNSARQSAAAPWYRRTYRWLSAQRAAAGSCGERHERGVLGNLLPLYRGLRRTAHDASGLLRQ